MNQIYLRADGNNKIGLGHIYRLLALAEMLQKGFKITFITQELPPSLKIEMEKLGDIIEMENFQDIEKEAQYVSQLLTTEDTIILDGYHFTTNYQNILGKRAKKVVCIDDLHAQEFAADVVLNHAPLVTQKDYKLRDESAFYGGTDYLILRNAFFQHSKHQLNTIENAFICFGGSDFHQLTEKAIDACIQTTMFKNIDVVIGSANQSKELLLKKYGDKISLHENLDAHKIITLIAKSAISIAPASTIALEICTIQSGLITGYYTDNQLEIYKGLIKSNSAVAAGDLKEISTEALKKHILTLNSVTKIEKIRASQQSIIDGKSPERILAIFKNL